MKMTKLFTSVFDEELKAHGFKRKAKLYYRLNGDILQGVVIKTVNPYSIHFYSAPYWMENYLVETFPLHKGYWAENGASISPSYAYYREENEQFNLDHMNICLDLAKEHILPVFEKMHDLNSYLGNCLPKWSGVGNEIVTGIIEINPAELNKKYQYINFPITVHFRFWDAMQPHYPFLAYACNNDDIKIGYDLLKKKELLLPTSWVNKESARKKYIEYMTDDGLERAKQYFVERREIMISRLCDELGLDVFNL